MWYGTDYIYSCRVPDAVKRLCIGHLPQARGNRMEGINLCAVVSAFALSEFLGTVGIQRFGADVECAEHGCLNPCLGTRLLNHTSSFGEPLQHLRRCLSELGFMQKYFRVSLVWL